jgi:2',3'-cyclic-nucleotide 2'-phosphodiesterase/3'-nucleotidase
VRVLDLSWHGEPLDPSRSFTLACNNSRAVGGGGYPHLAGAEVVWRSTEELTELIAGFLDRHRPWQPGADGNWSLALPAGQEAVLLSTAQ